MIRALKGRNPQIAPSAFVSEAAYVVGDVEIGEHASVWPGAVIRGDFCKIRIGSNSVLEDNCVVHGETDISIGRGVIVGHGAIVHCRPIGDNVLVGSNATILDGAEIGEGAIIAACSLIPPETRIPGRRLAAGIPAQIKGEISSEQLLRLTEGARLHRRLAGEYKRQGL